MSGRIKLIIISLFCILSSEIKSQGLTEKDFKLLIDGRTFSDSTVTINELLQMKKVSTNFSWISFKELVIYIDYATAEDHKRGVLTELQTTVCELDSICENAKKLFLKLRPGNSIVFQVSDAKNKSGNKLTVQSLYLMIK